MKLIYCFIPLLLYGCTAKPSNEISQMALECFKAKQSIRIEFIPHPTSHNALDEDVPPEKKK